MLDAIEKILNDDQLGVLNGFKQEKIDLVVNQVILLYRSNRGLAFYSVATCCKVFVRHL